MTVSLNIRKRFSSKKSEDFSLQRSLRVLQFLRTGLFMTALNFLAGNIPGLMHQLNRLSGLLLLAAWAGCYFPLKIGKSLPVMTAAFAILISFPLLLSETAVFMGLGLCIFSLTVLSQAEHAKKELPLFLLTALFYTLFATLYKFSPLVWYFFQNLSLGFSAKASGIAGNKMTLGASALGIPVSVSVLCYAASSFFLSQKAVSAKEKKRKFVLIFLTILSFVLANAAYLRLQNPLTELTHFFNDKWNPTPLSFQFVLLTLLTVCVHLIVRKSDIRNGTEKKSPFKEWRHFFPPLLVFIAVLTMTISFSQPGLEKKGVVFCDKGANWNVPVYGKRYGQGSAGMFGMLPQYLRMRGYESKITKAALTEKDLENAGVVAVFNPVRYFSDEEKELVRGFIEKGGSLVVAGDHTDVTGVMKPINELLRPFGMALNFDTALPVLSGWVGSLEKRPHAITRHIRNDYETAIWVGASLKISPPAVPVIVGKLGWADAGDYLNTRRAYLGDYKRSGEEPLGDVVLVAESRYGRGKVLVFGDTSTFQNGVLTDSYHFLDDIFGWLSGGGERSYPMPQLVLCLLVLTAGGYLLHKRPRPETFLFCLMAVYAALLTAEIQKTSRFPGISEFSDQAEYKPAYLDISHKGRFSVFASGDESLWGVAMNLMRNKYVPLFMKDFSEQALSQSDLYFVVAPTAEFSPKERDVLKGFMQKGGNIVWAVGWEEMEASKSFLEEFDLSLDAVPLGPARVDIGQRTVKFVEAWPIVGGDESLRIIAKKLDYPIAAYQPVGKGGLLLVGDSEFFHSKNIESYKNHYFDNIAFFKYLLNILKMGSGDQELPVTDH